MLTNKTNKKSYQGKTKVKSLFKETYNTDTRLLWSQGNQTLYSTITTSIIQFLSLLKKVLFAYQYQTLYNPYLYNTDTYLLRTVQLAQRWRTVYEPYLYSTYTSL